MELDDLKNIAPNLSKIKKEDNFSVPDGYFENFRQRLDEKIHEEKKVPFFEKIFQIARPQLALASLMMSVLVLGYIGFRFFGPNEDPKLNQTEIAQVLEDEIYYMDETFILENFSDKSEVEKNKEEISDELLNEIIDYLSDDETSLDLILEEL